MWKIKDNTVVGGDKVVTPYGTLIFERVHYTDDSVIADYFKNKVGKTVTEVTDATESLPTSKE